MGCFAGISAKQVQIILEDLRHEVERQSANGNNGIITASRIPVTCQPIYCILNTWPCKHSFIACLVFDQLSWNQRPPCTMLCAIKVRSILVNPAECAAVLTVENALQARYLL